MLANCRRKHPLNFLPIVCVEYSLDSLRAFLGLSFRISRCIACFGTSCPSRSVRGCARCIACFGPRCTRRSVSGNRRFFSRRSNRRFSRRRGPFICSFWACCIPWASCPPDGPCFGCPVSASGGSIVCFALFPFVLLSSSFALCDAYCPLEF